MFGIASGPGTLEGPAPPFGTLHALMRRRVFASVYTCGHPWMGRPMASEAM